MTPPSPHGAAGPTPRPVIGVTAYEETASWGVWHTSANLLPSSYVHSVEAAGGVPVLLPAQPGDVGTLVTRLDAVILTGGPDVDPEQYGAERQPATDEPRHLRDEFEIALLTEAASAGLPVLAICRGVQVLNVARGGTLVQHLPDVVGTDAHRPEPGVFANQHVRVDPTSKLAAALGAEEIEVSCHHHQAVDELGRGLSVVARSADGVVEAVEDTSAPFLIGVQWHPEEGRDLTLFTALVVAARTRA